MAEQDNRNHTKEANEREDLIGHDKGSMNRANSTSSKHIATIDPQSVPASSPDHDEQHDTVDSTSKPKVLSEINPNSVASISTASLNQTPPPQTKTNANADSKRVVIAEAADERSLVENEENDEAEYAGQTNEGPGVGVGSKKKKKRKAKSKRGLNAPSGFEEYYVDAPLTPAEFKEERAIYDAYYPFAQRVETAIQRFGAKRKMDPVRKHIFDKYLVHGGVEGGPKMFSAGLDANALSTMNATEIAELNAKHYVGGDKGGPNDTVWVVDFEGCLKSFLSCDYPTRWELTSQETIESHVNVIRNFLNYLLHHDVCPEYQSQIYAARTLCDQGQKELCQIGQLLPRLPGDFNMACSIIFGGMYQGMYESNCEWMDEDEKAANAGMDSEQARRVFKFALAANANDETFQTYKKQLAEKTCRITSSEELGLEVIDIILPNDEARSLYAQRQCSGLKTVGKLKVKSSFDANAAQDEDLTEEEEAALAAIVPDVKHYEFWVEEDVLQHMFVGMKLGTKVTHLSFGVSYFDAINGVHCSFFNRLPNQMMGGWREPEKEWLPMRPKINMDEGFEVYENQAPEPNLSEVEVVEEKELHQGTAGVPGAFQYGPKDDNDFENYFLTSKNTKHGAVEAGTDHSKPDVAPEDGGCGDPSVKVQKVTCEEKQVSGNVNKVSEETFDVVAKV